MQVFVLISTDSIFYFTIIQKILNLKETHAVFQLFLGGRLSKEIALVLNEISNTFECKKGTLSLYKSDCLQRQNRLYS